LRIHPKDGVVLDSIEEHPISFFAFPERALRKPTSALHLRKIQFRSLARAYIADHCRYQDSIDAFQRAQHDFNRKFATILVEFGKLNPHPDLLRQGFDRTSRSICDQPFCKTMGKNGLYLLPSSSSRLYPNCFSA
jgi:hypothetical protein